MLNVLAVATMTLVPVSWGGGGGGGGIVEVGEEGDYIPIRATLSPPE